jgi:hypothetical protein
VLSALSGEVEVVPSAFIGLEVGNQRLDAPLRQAAISRPGRFVSILCRRRFLVIRPTLLLIKIVAARANCHDFAACLTFYLSSQTVIVITADYRNVAIFCSL